VHPSTDCDTLPNVAFVETAAIDASAAPAHPLIRQFRQLFGNTRGLFGHHAASREALTSGSTILSAGLTCGGLSIVWRAKPGLLAMFVPTSDCQLYVTRFQQTLQHGCRVDIDFTNVSQGRMAASLASKVSLDSLLSEMSGVVISIPKVVTQACLRCPCAAHYCKASEPQQCRHEVLAAFAILTVDQCWYSMARTRAVSVLYLAARIKLATSTADDATIVHGSL